MSKWEWYFIGLINNAAHDHAANKPEWSALWQWINSKQHAAWIGHKDGPNHHPGGWFGWMAEFV